jgi:hypothetical protein
MNPQQLSDHFRGKRLTPLTSFFWCFRPAATSFSDTHFFEIGVEKFDVTLCVERTSFVCAPANRDKLNISRISACSGIQKKDKP